MIKGLMRKILIGAVCSGLSLTSISCCDMNCRFERVIREYRHKARKAEKAYLKNLDEEVKEGYMEAINKRIYWQDDERDRKY